MEGKESKSGLWIPAFPPLVLRPLKQRISLEDLAASSPVYTGLIRYLTDENARDVLNSKGETLTVEDVDSTLFNHQYLTQLENAKKLQELPRAVLGVKPVLDRILAQLRQGLMGLNYLRSVILAYQKHYDLERFTIDTD